MSNWYAAPERVRRGRVAQAYARGSEVPPPEGRRYIHLLDGGIADNLGLVEPIRLLSSQEASPLLLNQIADGRIRRLVFVMINARSARVSACLVASGSSSGSVAGVGAGGGDFAAVTGFSRAGGRGVDGRPAERAALR